MPNRRIVRHSLVFLAQAEAIFPPGGSSDGRASFEMFRDLLLPGVDLQCSAGFDDLPVSEPGVDAVRHVMTHGFPWFPPLVVYGILLSNDEIDLIGADVDTEYWRLIGDDLKD